jgi:hypothetical protein
MKAYDKKDFPVDRIRRFLEPGPIVLVSSAWSDKRRNLMTMEKGDAFLYTSKRREIEDSVPFPREGRNDAG